MVVSINGGSPKWMVYNGKSHSNRWFRGPPISGNFHLGSRTPADKSPQLRFHPEHRHHRPQRAHHPECNRIRPETVRIHGFFAMGLSHHEISLGIAMDSLYKLHYPQLLIIKKTGGNHYLQKPWHGIVNYKKTSTIPQTISAWFWFPCHCERMRRAILRDGVGWRRTTARFIPFGSIRSDELDGW